MKKIAIFILLSLIVLSVMFVGGCTPTTPKTSDSGDDSVSEPSDSAPSGQGSSGLPIPPPLPE